MSKSPEFVVLSLVYQVSPTLLQKKPTRLGVGRWDRGARPPLVAIIILSLSQEGILLILLASESSFVCCFLWIQTKRKSKRLAWHWLPSRVHRWGNTPTGDFPASWQAAALGAPTMPFSPIWYLNQKCQFVKRRYCKRKKKHTAVHSVNLLSCFKRKNKVLINTKEFPVG